MRGNPRINANEYSFCAWERREIDANNLRDQESGARISPEAALECGGVRRFSPMNFGLFG